MKHTRKWRKPSPAMIVAIAALSVSLVGTAVAGPIAEISLNKGEKKQIRKISRNIANRIFNSRAGKLVGPQGVPGPQGEKGEKGEKGEQGVKGDTGAPGSSVAYAHVLSNGDVDEANSKNVTDANVTRSAAGVYCFDNLSFSVNVVTVTPDALGPEDGILVNPTFPGGGLFGCDEGGARVRTTTAAAPNTASDHPFYIVFE